MGLTTAHFVVVVPSPLFFENCILPLATVQGIGYDHVRKRLCRVHRSGGLYRDTRGRRHPLAGDVIQGRPRDLWRRSITLHGGRILSWGAGEIDFHRVDGRYFLFRSVHARHSLLCKERNDRCYQTLSITRGLQVPAEAAPVADHL